MLGFERERKPISGKYARRIREQLYRIHTGHYNRTDCLILKFELEKPKYKCVWVGEDVEYLNPKFMDNVLSEFADTLSQYVVIVNKWVKFDFSKISRQMMFLKGYGLAKVTFHKLETEEYSVAIDRMDNGDEVNKDDIIKALTVVFDGLFKNDIKKKQYVYVEFDGIRFSEDKTVATVSLKMFRPYDEEKK